MADEKTTLSHGADNRKPVVDMSAFNPTIPNRENLQQEQGGRLPFTKTSQRWPTIEELEAKLAALS